MTTVAVNRRFIADFAPPLVAGLIACAAFVVVGATPIPRALAMGAAVIFMALALRPMGAALSVIGAMALAFSPSFWAQTGGAVELVTLGDGILGLMLAVVGIIGLAALVYLPSMVSVTLAGVGALVVFGFDLIAPQSLRGTTLLTGWLLFMLTEMLILTDIRPDAVLLTGRQPYRRDHAPLILLVMILGVANDPLFALWSPAVLLGVWLTRHKLHPLYWIALIGVALYGGVGIARTYIDPMWWATTADSATALARHIPFLVADGWREPARWFTLFDLVIRQFTPLGIVLGVIGLARLSRWHPPIGVVTMLAYGAYATFGLMYFGRDAATLLLPLLMIQLLWMTYAVYTLEQWAHKSLNRRHPLVLWFAPAAFTLLPLSLLLRIIGVI